MQQRVGAMSSAIRHRGPDDAGVWRSSDTSVWLAHQRLAIQDLSQLGHQPMVSDSGRYVIVFNGEIYNFKRLSAELEHSGVVFHGHSDTEVMLAAFEHWGVEQSLSRFDGMFAFAVYDCQEKDLWLARDRMGEKPLYYAFIDGCLWFCSELKGLLTGIDRKLALDWDAIGRYFRYGYFPVDKTPFAQVKKLRPASSIRVRKEDFSRAVSAEDIERQSRRYWALPAMAPAGGDESSLADQLAHLLSESVADQAVADVGVGVFLSGGIDSSLVAAMLQENSSRSIDTYTIAFDDPQYNEAPFAREISRHIGSRHTEIPVAMDECFGAIEKLPFVLDEPFADASIIPTYLVCREARGHVTVCLSGDGGDELFGGYNRYIHGAKLDSLRKRLPLAARSLGASCISAISESVLDAAYRPLSWASRIAGRKSEKDAGGKMHKLARALTAQSADELYSGLLSFWHESPLKETARFPGAREGLRDYYPRALDFSSAAMRCDLDFYLVCDNLFKVDRAAMASSLEVRLPFLDRRLVEFSTKVPLDQKIRRGQSKYILREVLYRYVPKTLMERPKMGFSVPLAEWFRGGLHAWAGDVLGDIDVVGEAGLDAGVIQRYWTAHQAGAGDYSNALWTAIAYLQWRSVNDRWIAPG
jgi:asparagine synthase (glutamine-hydrolysing)